MPNHTEKTLEGGRFETLFNLADNMDRLAARAVDVETELRHITRILENLEVTEDSSGDVSMDLIGTILSGLVVASEAHIDDALKRMKDVAADLRGAIASCRTGSSDELSHASESPVPRAPRRKRTRKYVTEARELTHDEFVRMLVDSTPTSDRNLLFEVDALPPLPEDPSFGDISPEDALKLMMRRSLFTEPIEDPNNVEAAVPTRLVDKPDLLVRDNVDTVDPAEREAPTGAESTVDAGHAVSIENILDGENLINVEQLAHIDENPPCNVTGVTLDLTRSVVQVGDALPQHEVAEGAAGPVPEETRPRNRPKKGKKKRSKPCLDLPIPAPHLRYQEVDQMQLVNAEMWHVAEKLLRNVMQVPDVPAPIVNQEEQECPRQGVSTNASTLHVEGAMNVEANARSPSGPTVPLPAVCPVVLAAQDIPVEPVFPDRATLQSKIEELLDRELIEFAKIANVDLVDFLIQLLPGPKTFFDFFPPNKTYKRQAAAAFQLILGMVQAGLILIFQDDVLKATPIIIRLEVRPELNQILSLLHEVANF